MTNWEKRTALDGLVTCADELAAMHKQYDALKAAFIKFHATVDDMMAPLGCYGTINNRDDRVRAVVDALYDADALLGVGPDSPRNNPPAGVIHSVDEKGRRVTRYEAPNPLARD